MTVSPWWALVLAVPVLLLGEALARRIAPLDRFSIPAPVVGGLLISLLVLAMNLAGPIPVRFGTNVSEPWWTWLVTTEPEWAQAPARNVSYPIMAMFFTCIGINASWDVVRKGSVQVVIFLGVATLFAIVQSGAGIALATALGVHPLLGLVCGSVTLTGGHGTAMGFAGQFEQLGLQGAAVLGAAAATVGLIAGGLLGGPVGVSLIRRMGRTPILSRRACDHSRVSRRGFVEEIKTARTLGYTALLHLLLLLACVKGGAWVSFFMQQSGISFSAQIGAMTLGLVVRNVLDALGFRWIRSDVITVLAAITSGLFLSMAMMSLNLIELAEAALPMLIILAFQMVVMVLFASHVTHRLMGRDYESAVFAAGHVGFAIGSTPNAVANMQSLTEKYGPAPNAFLVVPLIGAVLVDFTNALVITFFMNVAL